MYQLRVLAFSSGCLLSAAAIANPIDVSFPTLQNLSVTAKLYLPVANMALVVSQVELVEKKSMYFFAWQGGRRPHGEPCNDEQHRQAKKDAIYSRRFSLTDY
jgi:hypothetical protein